MFKNNPKYLLSVCSAIILGHAAMFIAGTRVINIDTHYQLIDKADLHERFWQCMVYMNGNPPGYSILILLVDLMSFDNRYVMLQILLPLMQCLSFVLFFNAVQSRFQRDLRIPAAILFLNPVTYIYFNYPFYCTILFNISCLLLYVLFTERTNQNKVLWLVGIFASMCFIRSSWHLYFITGFSIWAFIHYKAKARTIVIACMFLALPASVYVKNYILYGRFTSSTWLGINLSRTHLYPGCNAPISKYVPFYNTRYYESYVDFSGPEVTKFKDIPVLNRNNFYNVRYMVISDSFMVAVKRCFNPAFSLKQVLIGGVPVFFQTPVMYGILYNDYQVGTDKGKYPWYAIDFFDLPDIHYIGKSGKEFIISFSGYSIIYPLLLLLLLYNWRRLGFEMQLISIVILLFTSLYSVTDPLESNRMRYEIEPLYYFAVFYMASWFIYGRKEKRDKKPLTA
ncbi:MAG: hypothetical protein V4543_10425 [Bacteroidota bacterium]